MYQDVVITQEEAITHLFFHCCLKDGEYTTDELNALSEKIVVGGLNKTLNFTEEMQKYKTYYGSITDDATYLNYLVQLIRPTNELAIYSYCVELCLSDSVFAIQEESLLQKIGNALSIDETDQAVARKLMMQRNIVETQQLF